VADALGWLEVGKAEGRGQRLTAAKAYAAATARRMLQDPAECAAIDAAITAAGPGADPAAVAAALDASADGTPVASHPLSAPRAEAYDSACSSGCDHGWIDAATGMAECACRLRRLRGVA
jgi:hypothetical protein